MTTIQLIDLYKGERRYVVAHLAGHKVYARLYDNLLEATIAFTTHAHIAKPRIEMYKHEWERVLALVEVHGGARVLDEENIAEDMLLGQ